MYKAVESKRKLKIFEYIDQRRNLNFRNTWEHPVAYKITIVSYVILTIKTSNNYNNHGVLGAKSTSEVCIKWLIYSSIFKLLPALLYKFIFWTSLAIFKFKFFNVFLWGLPFPTHLNVFINTVHFHWGTFTWPRGAGIFTITRLCDPNHACTRTTLSTINVRKKLPLGVSNHTHSSSWLSSWSLIRFWYSAKSSFQLLLTWSSNSFKFSLLLLNLSSCCEKMSTPVRNIVELASWMLLASVWLAFNGNRLFTELVLERKILTRRSKHLIVDRSYRRTATSGAKYITSSKSEDQWTLFLRIFLSISENLEGLPGSESDLFAIWGCFNRTGCFLNNLSRWVVVFD